VAHRESSPTAPCAMCVRRRAENQLNATKKQLKADRQRARERPDENKMYKNNST